MPDMLVLTRDRRSGALRMSVAIDPEPEQPWRPGPLPEPDAHRECRSAWFREHGGDVEWFADAVEEYVDGLDPTPLQVSSVDWRGLRRDLETYAWKTRR